METSWKHFIFVNMRFKKIKTHWTNVCPGYHVCFPHYEYLILYINNEYILKKYFCGDEDLEMIAIGLIK